MVDKSAEFPLMFIRPRARGAREPEGPGILLLGGKRKGGGIVLIKYDKFYKDIYIYIKYIYIFLSVIAFPLCQ